MAKRRSKDRTELESEKRRISDEIRMYPTPIPACDAQFNYLLEERMRITRELDELKASEAHIAPADK